MTSSGLDIGSGPEPGGASGASSASVARTVANGPSNGAQLEILGVGRRHQVPGLRCAERASRWIFRELHHSEHGPATTGRVRNCRFLAGEMAKLGEMLVGRGLISREQLDNALLAQRQFGGRLGTNLMDLGYITDDELAACLSEQLKLPYARPNAIVAIAREVIARVPRAMAEKYRCVPLRIQGAELHIGMADPQNFQQLDELSFALAARLRPYVITEATLDTALEQYYGIRKAARLMQVATGGLMDFPDGGGNGVLMPDLAPAPLPVFDTMPVAPLAAPVPSAAARPAATMNVFEQLAAVMSDQDIVDSLFRYFSELFDEVIILAVREDRPVPVRAGNRLLHRQARHATSFSLAEGTLLRAVLAKPQIIHLPEVADREMVQLCASYNIACAQLAFISLFNDNRPAYIVAGQGRDHAYLKEAFSGLKRYVSKVAHALRIVALRNEIRAA
jgi:hypothetical protein